MNRTDLTVACLFSALGVYLVWGGMRLPPGVGRLPGPGFFPIVVGLSILAFALPLGIGALHRPGASPGFANGRAILFTLVLTGVYLLLWGAIPFALRTPLYLALLLRFLRVPWKQSLAVSGALTIFLIAAFQYGLRVSLE